MALKIEISFTISRQRLEALYVLYEYLIDQYVPETNEEHLLYVHATTFYWRLEETVRKPFKKETRLSVSEPEALAFCMLWGGWNISDQLARIAILDIIAKIDKQSKNPKTITNEQFRKTHGQ